MSIVTPNSTIRLLEGVKFTPSYNHIRKYANVDEQTNSLISLTKYSSDDYVFIRKDSAIRVPYHIDNLDNVNYLMYANNGKWYYCFIINKEYVNDHITLLELKTDVWQTYQFDITFHASFVEREHTKLYESDGSPVINTIDEGLEMGTEYDICKKYEYRPTTNNYYIVSSTTSLGSVLSGATPPENPPLPEPKMVQGLVSGLSHYIIKDTINAEGDYTPPSTGQGALYPFEGSYPVTSPYGERNDPFTGEPTFHYGIDYGAPTGTPVYGCTGTVIFAQFHKNSNGSPGYGNRVVIHEPNLNVFISYNHLNSFDVVEGEKLDTRKVIGTVGSTGASTGPHLDIRMGKTEWGSYIDPTPYMGEPPTKDGE